MVEAVSVPCGGCTACCHNEAIPLRPDDGDDPADYGPENLFRAVDPITGKWADFIKVKPSGECVFLERDVGCTIHEKRPAHCRVFDCRGLYLMIMQLNRGERRSIKKKYGLGAGPVFKAGKQRIQSLREQI